LCRRCPGFRLHQKNRLDDRQDARLGLHAAAGVCSNAATLPKSYFMKPIGFLLLLAGWFLTLAALEMLSAVTPRSIFVLAGVAIEILGLALVFRANLQTEAKD